MSDNDNDHTIKQLHISEFKPDRTLTLEEVTDFLVGLGMTMTCSTHGELTARLKTFRSAAQFFTNNGGDDDSTPSTTH